MLAACSNDDTVPVEGIDAAQPGSELTLTLNSGGDGMSTRANRPVNSSEAANNVTAVKLYIYNPSGTDVTAAALSAGTLTLSHGQQGRQTPPLPVTTPVRLIKQAKPSN